MKKLASAVGLAALAGALSGCAAIRSLQYVPELNDRVVVLGPEAMAFCGGWVQVWAHADTTSYARTVQLYLKASPPDGGTWEISNENVLAELPKQTTRRRRVSDLKQLDLGANKTLRAPGSGTVIQWNMSVEGLDTDSGITLYIRPFKGCDSKAIAGVTIKDMEARAE